MQESGLLRSTTLIFGRGMSLYTTLLRTRIKILLKFQKTRLEGGGLMNRHEDLWRSVCWHSLSSAMGL
jgi:hypothetical protein